jgi:LmbE family N-acetylglucosaminyl deacetylase
MTEPQQTRRVLAVFAHPDDPEFFCGATFARWAAEGAHITFVLVTSGDKGSSDPEMTPDRLIAIREAEERAAAAALGVHDVVFLRVPDGEVQPTLALRRAITRMIRLRQPDTVVTCDPSVYWFEGWGGLNHPDHRAVGEATLDAVYPTARDRLNFPELARDEGLHPHKVKTLYISGTDRPNVKVDVTAYLDVQLRALAEHKSQIADMAAIEQFLRAQVDPESPREAPRYMDAFRVITFDDWG